MKSMNQPKGKIEATKMSKKEGEPVKIQRRIVMITTVVIKY